MVDDYLRFCTKYKSFLAPQGSVSLYSIGVTPLASVN